MCPRRRRQAVRWKRWCPCLRPFQWKSYLCVALANAMENAIHACQAQSGDAPRRVKLELTLTDNCRLTLHVESFNHDRVCTLADGAQCVTSDTLTALMERLGGDSRFFSPHRAYIINFEHITALNADSVVLSNGQCSPVARTALSALKRAYVDYLSHAGH